jgi:hypothetical protein
LSEVTCLPGSNRRKAGLLLKVLAESGQHCYLPIRIRIVAFDVFFAIVPNPTMRTTFKVAAITALCLAAASIVTTQAGKDTSVTAAQVNGTWKAKWGEFKIWALGHQRLQIEFSGVYEYKTPQSPSANTGEGSGIATIEGDTATFKPEGAEEECRITLKFAGNKLVVTQTGICGFGHNVTAAGTYQKISAKKPKFEAG